MMILKTFWRFRYLYQTSKQFDIGLTTHLPLAAPAPKVVFVRCLRTWTAEKWLWEASPRRRCLTASQLNVKLWWLRRQRLFLLFFLGGGWKWGIHGKSLKSLFLDWRETPSTGSLDNAWAWHMPGCLFRWDCRVVRHASYCHSTLEALDVWNRVGRCCSKSPEVLKVLQVMSSLFWSSRNANMMRIWFRYDLIIFLIPYIPGDAMLLCLIILILHMCFFPCLIIRCQRTLAHGDQVRTQTAVIALALSRADILAQLTTEARWILRCFPSASSRIRDSNINPYRTVVKCCRLASPQLKIFVSYVSYWRRSYAPFQFVSDIHAGFARSSHVPLSL